MYRMASGASAGGARGKSVTVEDGDEGVDEEVSERGKCDCGLCGVTVKESDKALECEVCRCWYHIKCADIPADLYKCISRYKGKSGIHFYCAQCDVEAMKLVSVVKVLKEKQDKMEVVVDELKKEVKEMKVQMGLVRGYAEAASEKRGERGNSEEAVVSIRGGRDMQMQVTEAMERDRRKFNLVLMGVVEDETDSSGKDLAMEVLRELKVDEGNGFEYVGRVGRKATRPRPIRIKFGSMEAKRGLLTRAKNLRDITKFSRIYISNDLTRLQQEQDKKLRDKLREFREEGKLGVKISNGTIMQYVDGRQVVLFDGNC